MMIVFTAVIAAMAIAQTVIFWWQWQVMHSQLKTMNGQLKEMETTSKQLDELVKQATDNATAGKASADAASKNAAALVNSERAWVMTDLEHVPGYSGPSETTSQDGSESTNMSVRLICRNDGKTPAWITTKMAAMRIVEHVPRFEDMPPSMKGPIFGDFIEVCTEPLPVGKSSECDFTLTCEGFRALGKFLMIFGEVEYRDVFEPKRTTSFGYSVTDDNRFHRIVGIERYDAYNKNT